MTITLRNWQSECIKKSINWLTKVREDKHFVINAAPGSGKTITACVIANELIEKGEIDRVVVIAPRKKVVQQWADDFILITKRYMGKITSSDPDAGDYGHDLAMTWHSVKGLADALDSICKKDKVLVICDEHHHAALNAAWGNDAESGLSAANFVLILTGTPIRSDGDQTVWVNLDNNEGITHPSKGSYTLTYGEAVDLGYCRPVTFHRHNAEFDVQVDEGSYIKISGKEEPIIPNDLKSLITQSQLQNSLNFYGLARHPKYEKDNKTPSKDSFHSSMVEWAMEKLEDLKLIMPDAGGLVIAPSIEMAKYFQILIQIMDKDGQKPTLVHSGLANAEDRISAFEHNKDQKWLVSVNMVSEGVDIPRLRVLIYLPNATTELYFRQAIGRIVRKRSDDDTSRAYALIPYFTKFLDFARRVEEEMPTSQRKDTGKPRFKFCPVCETRAPLNANYCLECQHEFAEPKPPRMKECEKCNKLTAANNEICDHCGHKHNSTYVLSFSEALCGRDGAIVRGEDLDEDEVKYADEIAPELKKEILNSGDKNWLNLLKKMPDESLGGLVHLVKNLQKD